MPSGQRQGGGMPGGGGMNSPAVTGRTKVPRDVTLMGRQCVAPPVTLGAPGVQVHTAAGIKVTLTIEIGDGSSDAVSAPVAEAASNPVARMGKLVLE
ncbi:hypothetical protein EV648_101504 [Kribbella sp. VKM Ac-2568]|nr:hypothetical protein EV648_101504 [Kribbella sp. VKM Ac-2568]